MIRQGVLVHTMSPPDSNSGSDSTRADGQSGTAEETGGCIRRTETSGSVSPTGLPDGCTYRTEPSDGCNRRTVLSAIAGGTALAAAGSSTASARSSQDLDEPVAEPSGRVPDSLSLPPLEADAEAATLEGTVTVPPVEHAGSVLVGTSRGVYVLADGDVEEVIRTRPVQALTPLSDDRVAVVVADRFFPNVVVLDVSRGERLWAVGREKRVYNHERGFENRQVAALDAAPLEPETPTAGALVAATGYGVAAYDEDGDELWRRDLDYYAFSVTTADGTVYVGTQDGRVLALAADSGDEQFETEVTEDFDGIPRAVWDIVVDDGIVVSAEDGYVRRLADDGDIEWETEVLELDDDDLETYYRQQDDLPTMPGDPQRPADGNFFNVELTVTDGGFVARTREREPAGPGRDGRDAPGELVLVSPGGEIEWRNDAVALEWAGNVLYDAAVDSGHVFVPEGPEDAEQEVTKLDLETGSEAETLAFPARPGPELRRRQEGRGYLGAYDGELVVASATGDALVGTTDGDVAWSVPSLADGQVLQADFLGDGTDDYLVYTSSQFEDPREQFVTAIVLRSGTDGSVAWSWHVAVEDIREEGGLQDLRIQDTADPGLDLLAVESVPVPRDRRGEIGDLERELRDLYRPGDRPGEEEDPPEAEVEAIWEQLAELGAVSSLVELSGETGEIRRRIELRITDPDGPDTRVEPESLDVLELGGGAVDALIGGNDRVVFVDLLEEGDRRLDATLDDWWTYHDESPDQTWPPVGERPLYRTVTSPDAVDDIVAFDQRESAFAIVQTEYDAEQGVITFDAGSEIDLPDGDLDRDSIDVIGDLTGDGYEEVTCNLRDDDDGVAVVVEPGQEQVGVTVEGEARPALRRTVSPDGVPGEGLVAVSQNGDTMTASAFEGTDERFRQTWEFSERGRGRPDAVPDQPATLLEDIDGDGTPGLALAATGERDGMLVDIHALDTGQRHERVILDPFEEGDPDGPLVPVTRVDRIPEGTPDGRPALAVLATPTDAESPRMYVLDPDGGDLLVGGPGVEGAFTPVGDDAGLLGRDASLRTFDPTASVELDDPEEESELTLSWTLPGDRDHVTAVSVGDRSVAITRETETTVRLPSGTHEVEVAATNPDGLTTFDRTSVTVEADSFMDILLYALAGLSVAALFAIGVTDELRRRVQS